MRKFLIILASLALSTAAFAQEEEFGLGLVFNEAAYDKIPRKAEMLTRDYTVLPKSYSLKAFCPKPKSQGSHGTCTSWATAYAARTICDAVNNGLTDITTITREAFSPMFVYAQISNRRPGCRDGTAIEDALVLMKNKGVPKFSLFETKCACDVPNSLFDSAFNYKITDFFTLFDSRTKDTQKKIQTIKKALSENRPVIIGMRVYKSFDRAKDVWDGNTAGFRGAHAMCVIGYDDSKYGGAFELMNSWGTTWGNNGFTWVKYADFCREVDYAYEMYVERNSPQPSPSPTPTPKPKPTPTPVLPKHSLSGVVSIALSTGDRMKGFLENTGEIPHYAVSGSYPSGTRYRVYLSNDEPAYVYVIGSDQTEDVFKLFPPAENISPALVYSRNNIALPDEKWYIEMDNTKGTDYLCVLYSHEALPIQEIIRDIKRASGSFESRVAKALQGRLVPADEIKYDRSVMKFKASSYKTVVPVIVTIKHV